MNGIMHPRILALALFAMVLAFPTALAEDGEGSSEPSSAEPSQPPQPNGPADDVYGLLGEITGPFECGVTEAGRPDGFQPPADVQPDLQNNQIDAYVEVQVPLVSMGGHGASLDFNCVLPV